MCCYLFDSFFDPVKGLSDVNPVANLLNEKVILRSSSSSRTRNKPEEIISVHACKDPDFMHIVLLPGPYERTAF